MNWFLLYCYFIIMALLQGIAAWQYKREQGRITWVVIGAAIMMLLTISMLRVVRHLQLHG